MSQIAWHVSIALLCLLALATFIRYMPEIGDFLEETMEWLYEYMVTILGSLFVFSILLYALFYLVGL